jgi:hypothetical protein
MDSEIRPGNGDTLRAQRRREEHELEGRGQAEAHEHKLTVEAVAAGSAVESVCGIGAAVLGILALAGVLPRYLVPVATIALGAALVSQGWAIAARFSDLTTSIGGRHSRVGVGGGMSAEFLGGTAVVTLGILALIGLMPLTLTAVAIVAFGGSLLVGGAAAREINEFGDANADPERSSHLAREAARTASGTEVLVGLGGVALGILALVGIEAATLVAVAVLAYGAAVMFGGAAVGGRLASVVRH